MLTVLGDAPLEEACSSINAQPGKVWDKRLHVIGWTYDALAQTLSVANYLAPGIRVASGLV